ncbi:MULTISPECIES: LysR family transcriptional regulator [Marinomonas]|uniref:DNA-binding transcriptional LysR family regulator n=2 Tax=Marinomonas TaxID=28253 RepID=A0A366CUR8_9GAMM|nr:MULTISPECIES: LysR family transcriptional regulator [Marinomonas]AEF53585.1 transcriptional regulator, LysR family [Marinomonas posidonica IVIA-Po-181]RBO80065.1 DNA-binding transcriptional LysR family regulator [Marinomonas aquiplantarum]
MHLDEILKLDIKLLVAFVTIMEEGSVSRAAERLGVTQPALSKSLQRLRDLFKDTLFTRQAYGLTPTARASELHDAIQPILSSLSELMSPNSLDLKTLDRRFKLRVDEGDLENFIEALLASMQYQAPNVRLSISSWGESHFEEIISGNADIGIMRVSDTPNNVRSKLVGYMSACIILSEASPLFNQTDVSVADLLAHKVVTHHLRSNHSTPFSKTEQKLRQQGHNIQPTLETDSLMVAMQAVKRGMALVTSRSIGDLFLQLMREKNNFYPVKLLEIPQEIIELDEYNGRYPIHICWHERFNNDLAHRWLREKIIAFMRESPWMHSPT